MTHTTEAPATIDRAESGLQRRALLKGAVGAAFTLGFVLPVRGNPRERESLTGNVVNAFLEIGDDNIVTAIVAQAEMGQGSTTGITQVTAAELGADWALMRFHFTTERKPEYVNPTLYENLVLTAGSSSITGFYLTIRQAAATAREMLVAAAAKRWSVEPQSCTVANSFVTHTASGRKFTFGQLASEAVKVQVPVKAKLRSLADMPLIGQPLARLDVPPKCNGTARYGLDADVRGMLYAAVRHGPAWGADIATIDASKAKAMPGVKLVMAVPQGVAVVADQYWRAVKALAEVKESYQPHKHAAQSSKTVEADLRLGLAKDGATTPGSRGDVAVGFKTAKTVLEAEFYLPHMAHACIEPVSCTASVVGNRCEIWLSTKSSTLDAGFAGQALGIDPATVVVHNEYLGGDFGRRSGREHVTEAVLLSKAAGKPVKVVWTRAEDLRVDQHRTVFLGKVRLGLDAQGTPVAYDAKIACGGAWEVQFPEWFAKKKPMDLPMFSLVGGPYGIPHEMGKYVAMQLPVRSGPWRGNQELHNGFMLETIIDEAAHTLKRDPLAYRRSLVAKDARSVRVLDRAAELARWRKVPSDRYQGVCFIHSAENWHCRMAVIVDVSKVKEEIKVERMVCVVDSGLVINMNLARQCIEGGLMFGLSNALYEEITLAGGAPEQTNFHEYRLLRMSEAPDITVEVISVGEEPGAFGEISSTPVGPALGNAIFHATGKRLRRQPYSAQGVSFV